MKSLFVKLLAGTIARGILWGLGLLAQYVSVTMPEDTAVEAIGLFLAGLVIETFAALWSIAKNSKLVEQYVPTWIVEFFSREDVQLRFKQVAAEVFKIDDSFEDKDESGGA